MRETARYAEAQSDINSLKTKMSRRLLDKTIDEFHETVHSAEVERQKRGILPAAEVLNPATIMYELDERATVARLLFQSFDDMMKQYVCRFVPEPYCFVTGIFERDERAGLVDRPCTVGRKRNPC
jgi:hypothetical protein